MNFYKSILFTIKLFIMGCSFGTNYNNDIPFYKEIYEDHSNGYTYPDSGHYYQYKFSHYTDKMQNIDSMLHQFIDEGIVVYNAWYQEGRNGCLHANGALSRAIHNPIFLVMTKEEYPEFEDKNFYPVYAPGLISICGNLVLKYYLVNYR